LILLGLHVLLLPLTEPTAGEMARLGAALSGCGVVDTPGVVWRTRSGLVVLRAVVGVAVVLGVYPASALATIAGADVLGVVAAVVDEGLV